MPTDAGARWPDLGWATRQSHARNAYLLGCLAPAVEPGLATVTTDEHGSFTLPDPGGYAETTTGERTLHLTVGPAEAVSRSDAPAGLTHREDGRTEIVGALVELTSGGTGFVLALDVGGLALDVNLPDEWDDTPERRADVRERYDLVEGETYRVVTELRVESVLDEAWDLPTGNPVDEVTWSVEPEGESAERVGNGEWDWAFYPLELTAGDVRVGALRDFLYKQFSNLYALAAAVASRERTTATEHDQGGGVAWVRQFEGEYVLVAFSVRDPAVPEEGVWVDRAALFEAFEGALVRLATLVAEENPETLAAALAHSTLGDEVRTVVDLRRELDALGRTL